MAEKRKLNNAAFPKSDNIQLKDVCCYDQCCFSGLKADNSESPGSIDPCIQQLLVCIFKTCFITELLNKITSF